VCVSLSLSLSLSLYLHVCIYICLFESPLLPLAPQQHPPTYTYICENVCLCVCVCVCVCVRAYVCESIYRCTFIYMYVCISAYLNRHGLHIYIYVLDDPKLGVITCSYSWCVFAWLFVVYCLFVCLCVCLFVCMYVYNASCACYDGCICREIVLFCETPHNTQKKWQGTRASISQYLCSLYILEALANRARCQSWNDFTNVNKETLPTATVLVSYYCPCFLSNVTWSVRTEERIFGQQTNKQSNNPPALSSVIKLGIQNPRKKERNIDWRLLLSPATSVWCLASSLWVLAVFWRLKGVPPPRPSKTMGLSLTSRLRVMCASFSWIWTS